MLKICRQIPIETYDVGKGDRYGTDIQRSSSWIKCGRGVGHVVHHLSTPLCGETNLQPVSLSHPRAGFSISLLSNPSPSMFARLTQLTRHLYRSPFTCPPAYFASSSRFSPSSVHLPKMTSSFPDKKTIHTAACLIIGDEVLGGKVTGPQNNALGIQSKAEANRTDRRHKLCLLRQILLLARNPAQAH